MKKLDSLTCHQILKLSNLLFFSGMGLLLLAWIMVSVEDILPTTALLAIPIIGGVVLIVAGLALAFGKLRCPYCGESLCLGGRLPTRLPQYCPGCGKKL